MYNHHNYESVQVMQFVVTDSDGILYEIELTLMKQKYVVKVAIQLIRCKVLFEIKSLFLFWRRLESKQSVDDF
jgi:hypothetical protein